MNKTFQSQISVNLIKHLNRNESCPYIEVSTDSMSFRCGDATNDSMNHHTSLSNDCEHIQKVVVFFFSGMPCVYLHLVSLSQSMMLPPSCYIM